MDGMEWCPHSWMDVWMGGLEWEAGMEWNGFRIDAWMGLGCMVCLSAFMRECLKDGRKDGSWGGVHGGVMGRWGNGWVWRGCGGLFWWSGH